VSSFDRPVFILAPPRSGSSLLFETLQCSSQLWSLGDEGHGIIERHEELRPRPFTLDSNRLLAKQCTASLARSIHSDFQRQVRNRDGRPLDFPVLEPVRLLEKTPKNILRIPFLLQLFPDARFIYLVRDARDNISSIMDGWLSGRFATYGDKKTRHGPWSFLVPPGWQERAHEPLAGIAAFQWAECHEHAMRDLSEIAPQHWCAVNYAEFVADTEDVVERLCQFMEVPFDGAMRDHCRGKLPLSRYTLSQPEPDKWRRHERELAPQMAAAAAVSHKINTFIGEKSWHLPTDLRIDLSVVSLPRKIRRNEPCPCGSGKKYKHCHGCL
jgi:Sulfotransferase family/SEC-C motif